MLAKKNDRILPLLDLKTKCLFIKKLLITDIENAILDASKYGKIHLAIL
jgi:hypothetical protein